MIDYIPIDNNPVIIKTDVNEKNSLGSDQNHYHYFNYSTGTKLTFVNIDIGTPSGSYINSYNEEYISLVQSYPWVIDFLSKSSLLDDVKSLLPYYSKLNELIYNEEYSSLDLFIKNLYVHQLSDVLLVGILRLTFSIKEFIPSWDNLLSSAKAEFENRGHIKEEVLRGL